ncbi:substrate-binding domain-containing protein [Thalassospira sp.]|uniref:substrate-binding domain-containing protein n=1 Tax=Thalassospira sp. TaxID=1912094 RepID=UPI0027358682|nr:substrate-binding domain-containing protein [Thalassospira sp.]MDP2699895.1 substrate-binding domain-containing protein [Thalassospira sp.]
MRTINQSSMLWIALMCFLAVPVPALSTENELSLEEMQMRVAEASNPNPPWTGPTTGAIAQKGKRIAVIAEDLRNGGILGVAQGVAEAAKILEWPLKIFDAGGTPKGRVEAIQKVLSGAFDGLILIGSDAEALRPQLSNFSRQNIPIVGWHVGPEAGVMTNSPVSVNVSTDPLEVAKITAMAAVIQSQGKAGVVIFTDSNFEIAISKANAMAEVIKACHQCSLLEIRDVAISDSHSLMAGTTQDLLLKYGQDWTYALAINDIYFDYMMPELIKQGTNAQDINLLSAGDGSAAAFQRIFAQSFQVGTVAEPLNLHGWQLVDELNRLFAGDNIDGHVVPVHLVTPENVSFDGGQEFIFDPDNGYRDIYLGIWMP